MATPLTTIVDVLQQLAPLQLAEDWDNVGLLLDPEPQRRVRAALLTIDLTEPVLDEALAARCELIVAYHPPIFRPLKRLAAASPGERVVLRAARAGLTIYSPHTALDACPGGVNDWLAEGLGAGTRTPLEPRATPATVLVHVGAPTHASAAILTAAGAQLVLTGDGGTVARVPAAAAPAALAALRAAGAEPAAWRAEPQHDPERGQGRLVQLARPAALSSLVKRIKRHLGLSRVRLATAARHAAGEPIATVALCAGAGGAVLEHAQADLLWTGEMRHHDVLAAIAHGTSVVLCEHTNTERGYLAVLREALAARIPGVSWAVATSDRDPLRSV
ncbi:MAG: Nif3-like dinuclear metal center hexameric protein [Planctomycetes bacterium]|nr:Nif3-like dinuclear metal center hexameric protein [Planctomycetota bacterium]